MALPPELVEGIPSYLRHDRRALQRCSLVAKLWSYPSQKLFFASVKLTPETLQLWRGNVSPTSAELLQYVRTLACVPFYPIHALYHSDLSHSSITSNASSCAGSNASSQTPPTSWFFGTPSRRYSSTAFVSPGTRLSRSSTTSPILGIFI